MLKTTLNQYQQLIQDLQLKEYHWQEIIITQNSILESTLQEWNYIYYKKIPTLLLKLNFSKLNNNLFESQKNILLNSRNKILLKYQEETKFLENWKLCLQIQYSIKENNQQTIPVNDTKTKSILSLELQRRSNELDKTIKQKLLSMDVKLQDIEKKLQHVETKLQSLATTLQYLYNHLCQNNIQIMNLTQNIIESQQKVNLAKQKILTIAATKLQLVITFLYQEIAKNTQQCKKVNKLVNFYQIALYMQKNAEYFLFFIANNNNLFNIIKKINFIIINNPSIFEVYGNGTNAYNIVYLQENKKQLAPILNSILNLIPYVICSILEQQKKHKITVSELAKILLNFKNSLNLAPTHELSYYHQRIFSEHIEFKKFIAITASRLNLFYINRDPDPLITLNNQFVLMPIRPIPSTIKETSELKTLELQRIMQALWKELPSNAIINPLIFNKLPQFNLSQSISSFLDGSFKQSYSKRCNPRI